jgi:hypothetical protein
MSKELPYFKFHCEQWLGKKITLESFEMQGIFINVCAIYWANDCDIKIATLQKRYGEAINFLISESFIKDVNGIAKISFLDSQWKERYKIHQKNSKNGKAGALKRWGSHSEANGEANGEAIKKGIAIRKDKIREDKIREDNKKNMIDFFFEDFPNSTHFESICRIQNIEPELLLKQLEVFKIHADLSYPTFEKFANHFKNWVKLNPPTNPEKPKMVW